MHRYYKYFSPLERTELERILFDEEAKFTGREERVMAAIDLIRENFIAGMSRIIGEKLIEEYDRGYERGKKDALK